MGQKTDTAKEQRNWVFATNSDFLIYFFNPMSIDISNNTNLVWSNNWKKIRNMYQTAFFPCKQGLKERNRKQMYDQL